ncbi:hypothetical protein SRHO_G00088950 [Serrasalmus rhombeus]
MEESLRTLASHDPKALSWCPIERVSAVEVSKESRVRVKRSSALVPLLSSCSSVRAPSGSRPHAGLQETET